MQPSRHPSSSEVVDLDVRVSSLRCLDGGVPLDGRHHTYVVSYNGVEVACGEGMSIDGGAKWKNAARLRGVAPGRGEVTISVFDQGVQCPDTVTFTMPQVTDRTLHGASHTYRTHSKAGRPLAVKISIRHIVRHESAPGSPPNVLSPTTNELLTLMGGLSSNNASSTSTATTSGVSRLRSPTPASPWGNVPRGVSNVSLGKASVASSSVRLPADPVDLQLEMAAWIREYSGGSRPFASDWHPWEVYSLFRFFSTNFGDRSSDHFDIMDFKEYAGKAPCYYSSDARALWFAVAEVDESHFLEDERAADPQLLRLNAKPGYKGYGLDGKMREGVVLGPGCPVCTFVHCPEDLEGDEWARERLKKAPPPGEWWKYGHWGPKKASKLFQRIVEKALAARGRRYHPCGPRAVTRFELCKALFKIMGEYRPPSGTPEVRTGPLLQSHLIFKAFDADCSGYMDEGELKRVFHALGQDDADLAVEEVEMLFDRISDERNARLLGAEPVFMEGDGKPIISKRVLANILCDSSERPSSDFAFFAINLAHITAWRLLSPVPVLSLASCLPCLPSANPIAGNPSCTPGTWTCCTTSMPPFTELPSGKGSKETPQELFLLFLAFSGSSVQEEMDIDEFLEFLDDPAVNVPGTNLSDDDLHRLQVPRRLISLKKDGSCVINLKLAWRRRELQRGEKMRCYGPGCAGLEERGVMVPVDGTPHPFAVCTTPGCGSQKVIQGCCNVVDFPGVKEAGHQGMCRPCYDSEKNYCVTDRIKAENLFARLDDSGDRNGRVSRAELLCGVLEAIGKLQSEADSERVRSIAGDMFVKVFFAHHDADNSGTLSVAELQTMMRHITASYNYSASVKLDEEAATKAKELMADLRVAHTEWVQQWVKDRGTAPPHNDVLEECLKQDMINEELLKMILAYREKGKTVPKWGVLVPYFSHMMTFPQQNERVCYFKPFRNTCPASCVCDMCLLYDAETDDRPNYHIDACMPTSCTVS